MDKVLSDIDKNNKALQDLNHYLYKNLNDENISNKLTDIYFCLQ